jgi:Tfp pilus assembly protein PilF
LKLLNLLSVEFNFNRANINYKNKKYDKVLEDVSKIISRDPNYTHAYILRANIYSEAGDKEKAVENYKFAKQYDIKYGKFADSEIKILSKNKQ